MYFRFFTGRAAAARDRFDARAGSHGEMTPRIRVGDNPTTFIPRGIRVQASIPATKAAPGRLAAVA
jgi:hypothetical protein